MCTCRLDVENPVAVEADWDEKHQLMKYTITLKPNA